MTKPPPLGQLTPCSGVIFSTWEEGALCPDQRDVTDEDLRAIGYVPAVELEAAQKERDEAIRKKDLMAAALVEALAERREALATLRLTRTPTEDVWFWEDGGHNHPSSLVCPVVMSAATLRELVAERYAADMNEGRPWLPMTDARLLELRDDVRVGFQASEEVHVSRLREAVHEIQRLRALLADTRTECDAADALHKVAVLQRDRAVAELEAARKR